MTRFGIVIAGAAAAVIVSGVAFAQPYPPGYGMGGPGMGMGGPGMGMGGPGRGMGMGGGMLAFSDVNGYADALHAQLGITPAQEPAWRDYVGTLKSVSSQIQGVHRTLWEAMGTASWQERRDMLNRAFDTRQAVFNTMQAAAQKLLPALSPAQRNEAGWLLPGLRAAGPGYGMRGPAMGPGRRF
jgi:hypothetical protein